MTDCYSINIRHIQRPARLSHSTEGILVHSGCVLCLLPAFELQEGVRVATPNARTAPRHERPNPLPVLPPHIFGLENNLKGSKRTSRLPTTTLTVTQFMYEATYYCNCHFFVTVTVSSMVYVAYTPSCKSAVGIIDYYLGLL